MILLCSLIVAFISSCSSLSKSAAPSSLSANSPKISATAALSMMFAQAMLFDEPSILNSNLLPVNANGDVLFLSVESFLNSGRMSTPSFIFAFLPLSYSESLSIASSTASSSSPRNIEITAGGASFAPSLWSLPAVATERRSRSWYSSTALITATRKSRNCAFSYGVSPGVRRFAPVSVEIDQLLCLPLPFTPANGFSWSRQTRPCFAATFCIISIVSWLLSVAIFVVE